MYFVSSAVVKFDEVASTSGGLAVTSTRWLTAPTVKLASAIVTVPAVTTRPLMSSGENP